MTGFRVEPGALDTFAGSLGRGDHSLARLYMTSALTYVDNWVRLPEGQSGIAFSALSETTARVAAQMRTDNAVIGARLSDSAANLVASAAVYRRTDHASASRLDQQYDPPGGMADGGNYAATAGSDPTTQLWIPTADNGAYDVVNSILSQTSWASLSGVVLHVLASFGFDPMGALTTWLFGDAEAVSRVGNALARHAAFDRECSGLLTTGRTTMHGSWTGTAATAADGYFDDLADALLERSEILHRISGQYVEFAMTIDSLSSELSTLIQAAIEPALQVAASLAAAGCLAEIPPAAGVALLVGAWRTQRLIKAVQEFADAVDRIWTPAQGLLAIITTTDAVTKEYDASSRIPATAYHTRSQPG